MAPQQPRNPTISTIVPAEIHRAVTLRKLKLGLNEAYAPLLICNHIPIPRVAHPSNYNIILYTSRFYFKPKPHAENNTLYIITYY